MAITTATDQSIVQCNHCHLVHAYMARKSKPVDSMFNVSVCPKCEKEGYRNTETDLAQKPSLWQQIVEMEKEMKPCP